MVGLAAMLLLSQTNAIRPFNNSLDVLCWLGYVLVMALIILWPHSGKDERQRKGKRSPAWADGIDFDSMGRDRR
jgi:hypothetical protein